ncbi:Ni/Fe-hydrogenase, b-type cytochrome subunit [Desulfosporosinus nitroreducens]|uniref:Ni/Fe-hydrogenase, b-type cytochrome subunit n=1 Tax=Desulfosporosinus nitroreducens TaxID=2018668 RepID=A0ABT8QQF3_9FIRM|nr:Ni/Fe-hydrogenase, b-type cytochrome subunit [Desulfosporosinus nitroreducens]MCO1600161.1 Ni/Fe-hydrogenase, b-type cytochrome subunit [Desulfosporosinus nitroreducens]MDO0822809.1 Ni/Fe-hydrogenase, b-type cytochrome subunit [Desulfosporosinus nitroreducens]
MSSQLDLDHPLFQRISHWINLINFLFLGITGWFIHSPYQGMPMSLVRNLHFIFMYLLIINGIVRFYYSFFGKHKDYDTFFFNSQDLKTTWPQIKYYLFLGKHPKTGKYNPLQKMAYIALPIMAVVQAVTGFILYKPVQLASLADSFGGLAAVRGFHYLLMWLFIAVIAVHLYLVFTAAYEQFLFMFFGKIRKEKSV